MEYYCDIHLECVQQTTDDGQTIRIFRIFRILSDSQDHEKDACCTKCIFLYTDLYHRILDTTKTYLQGTYRQCALHICPCKDMPEMGHTVDMPTGIHQWKTYHRNVLSCEIHDNC
jgi:hypothetical protein